MGKRTSSGGERKWKATNSHFWNPRLASLPPPHRHPLHHHPHHHSVPPPPPPAQAGRPPPPPSPEVVAAVPRANLSLARLPGVRDSSGTSSPTSPRCTGPSQRSTTQATDTAAQTLDQELTMDKDIDI